MSELARKSAAPRSELVDRAYRRLRDLIVSGGLPPGSPIIETEVAAALRVNRSHLRAAIQRLQQSGFVVSEPIGVYSRTRVAPLTLADARELFVVVGALEGVAIREVARLPATRRRVLVADLNRFNAALRAAAAPRDVQGAFDADLSFHQLFVEVGAGSRVRALHAAVKPQSDRYERLYTGALVEETGVWALEHDEIVVAIRRGDLDRAQRAVETNWRNAAERFEAAMMRRGWL